MTLKRREKAQNGVAILVSIMPLWALRHRALIVITKKANGRRRVRLIDVDVLKADYGMADDCKDCKTGWRSCQYDRIYSKMDFCGWLDDAPTVDAVPVRHGRWRNGFCDQCGGHAPFWTMAKTYYQSNFCPNCGADMREDGEHD